MRKTYRPPFLSISDVTVSRSLDTVYQNTTGKLMLVFFNIRAVRGGGVDSPSAFGQAYIGDANPPTTNIASAGLGTKSSDTDSHDFQFSFIVYPLWYWKVASSLVGAGSSLVRLYVFEVT